MALELVPTGMSLLNLSGETAVGMRTLLSTAGSQFVSFVHDAMFLIGLQHRPSMLTAAIQEENLIRKNFCTDSCLSKVGGRWHEVPNGMRIENQR